MAKYIVEIPDEIEISKDSQLVPFDMCRPSWWEEAYDKGKADAERKTGKWILKPHPNFGKWGMDILVCSKCGHISSEYTSFCPSCGAKMEELK